MNRLTIQQTTVYANTAMLGPNQMNPAAAAFVPLGALEPIEQAIVVALQAPRCARAPSQLFAGQPKRLNHREWITMCRGLGLNTYDSQQQGFERYQDRYRKRLLDEMVSRPRWYGNKPLASRALDDMKRNNLLWDLAILPNRNDIIRQGPSLNMNLMAGQQPSSVPTVPNSMPQPSTQNLNNLGSNSITQGNNTTSLPVLSQAGNNIHHGPGPNVNSTTGHQSQQPSSTLFVPHPMPQPATQNINSLGSSSIAQGNNSTSIPVFAHGNDNNLQGSSLNATSMKGDQEHQSLNVPAIPSLEPQPLSQTPSSQEGSVMGGQIPSLSSATPDSFQAHPSPVDGVVSTDFDPIAQGDGMTASSGSNAVAWTNDDGLRQWRAWSSDTIPPCWMNEPSTEVSGIDNEGSGVANEGSGVANEGSGVANEGSGTADNESSTTSEQSSAAADGLESSTGTYPILPLGNLNPQRSFEIFPRSGWRATTSTLPGQKPGGCAIQIIYTHAEVNEPHRCRSRYVFLKIGGVVLESGKTFHIDKRDDVILDRGGIFFEDDAWKCGNIFFGNGGPTLEYGNVILSSRVPDWLETGKGMLWCYYRPSHSSGSGDFLWPDDGQGPSQARSPVSPTENGEGGSGNSAAREEEASEIAPFRRTPGAEMMDRRGKSRVTCDSKVDRTLLHAPMVSCVH